MDPWLLSAHHPRESFGVPYPISSSFFINVLLRRQMEHLVGSLAGGTRELDSSLSAMVLINGRPYLNISSFARNMGLVLPFDPSSLGAPRGLVESEVSPRLATRLLLPFRFWLLYRSTIHACDETTPLYRETMKGIYWDLRRFEFGRLAEQELNAVHRLFSDQLVESMMSFVNTFIIVSLLNITVSKTVIDRAPELQNQLVGYGSSTALLAVRMWELRTTAKDCGSRVTDMLRRGVTCQREYREIPEAKPLLDEIERLLEVYGHRAFQYGSEFEATRLVDQPELVFLTTGCLLGEDQPPTVRAEAARQVGLQALKNLNPFSRFVWSAILKWGSRLIELREEGRDTMDLLLATYGLAARLLSRHYFPDQPPDYLWLYSFDEFMDFGKSKGTKRIASERIEQRRDELERNRLVPPAPELVWYDPQTKHWFPVEEQAEERSTGSRVRLEGIGASAGTGPVEGIALVTDSVEEAANQLLSLSGSVILVTHVTDPVWSSLFRRLTAVVTETGGVISHAAIVARENGIPSVVGVAGATSWIRTGQWLRVDGSKGVVEVI